MNDERLIVIRDARTFSMIADIERYTNLNFTDCVIVPGILRTTQPKLDVAFFIRLAVSYMAEWQYGSRERVVGSLIRYIRTNTNATIDAGSDVVKMLVLLLDHITSTIDDVMVTDEDGVFEYELWKLSPSTNTLAICRVCVSDRVC